ncbi:MAG: YcxB family protein [Thermonemataceae bacterium]|nr:YcxB family protein [Thermonemataceae bacterium]
MLIKTKKYELSPKTYRRLGIQYIFKKQWWLPAAIFAGVIVLNILINVLGYRNLWIYFLALIGAWGWYLFWWIQYTGIPQMPQNKVMFEKFTYEITSQQILIKKTATEGMVIKWEMIKEVTKTKDAFVFILSKAQFLHFPFKIFNSENEIKFLEAILQRKNLLVSNNKPENNSTNNVPISVQSNGAVSKTAKK